MGRVRCLREAAVAVQCSGRTRFQLLDEDGDELPGTWEFFWEGRDPFEAVMAAITEVSGRPWRYSARSSRGGRFSPARARAMSVRVKNVLRPTVRPRVAAVLARVVRDEFETRSRRVVDPAAVLAVLSGEVEPTEEALESCPELLAATMLVAFRSALRTARECGGGLRVSWRVE